MKLPTAALLILALIPACSTAPSTPAPDPAAVEEKMIGLQEHFDDFDRNGDDQLSHAELKQGMIKVGAKDTSDARVSKIIEFYDFNRDGQISLREAQSGAVTGPEELIKKISN